MRTIGVLDSGFQQGFGSLQVQSVSNKLLLHGEACPMTASKPEQPTRKAFRISLAEGGSARGLWPDSNPSGVLPAAPA